MFVAIISCEWVNGASYLEQDLDGSIDHTHPPAQEGEEREDELDEVVGQRLEAMEPPRGAMHVVRHGVRNRLGLGKRRRGRRVKPGVSLRRCFEVANVSEKAAFVKIIMIFNQHFCSTHLCI